MNDQPRSPARQPSRLYASGVHLLLLLTLLLTAWPPHSVSASPHLTVERPPITADADLLQFTSAGHVLGFAPNGFMAATPGHALRVTFVNAQRVIPQSANTPKQPTQAAPLTTVTYPNLWPGVTLTYDAAGIVRSTYRLDPYADVKAIRLRYNRPIQVQRDGSLRIAVDGSNLTESAPIAWQERQGRRVPVTVSFTTPGAHELGFALGAYNPAAPLWIDPTLLWNTFLGGTGNDSSTGIVVDASGNIYVVGTSDATWVTPINAFAGGPQDVFVAKLDNSGTRLWHTFLGGTGSDTSRGLALDSSGNLYVAGSSNVTWGTPINGYGGGSQDAFAAKLDSSGTRLWHTFLGGAGSEAGFGIAVDSSGNVYVVGNSNATWGTPVNAYTGGTDAFAAKLDSSGTRLWHTFLGGTGSDAGNGIAVDSSGNTYVAGGSGTTWGTPLNAFAGGIQDVFAAKLDSNGTRQWHTFLGGTGNGTNSGLAGNDTNSGIAVDSSGNVYVVGNSNATWGTPVNAYTGGPDAVVAKLDSNGTRQWHTFLGGTGSIENGFAIAVDSSGNVYLAGVSNATWGTPLNAYVGTQDAFAAKLDSNGARQWHNFLGGTGSDAGNGIAVDSSGNTYVAGNSSATWRTPLNAYAGGSTDLFVAKIDNIAPPEIDIQGNSLSIVSGDTTPSTSDGTDFGSVAVSSGTAVRTFTIQNSGATALALIGANPVSVSGANAGDFTVTQPTISSVAANSSTTFQITFDPSAAGVRTATVTIVNNDGSEGFYTFAIQGRDLLPDADGDGIPDASDNCPAVANADQLNSDNDAQGNACDTDDDNDGVLDVNDAFPLNAAEAVDTDGDGTGNNADTDDDNDGVADVNDAFPLNAAESVDTDGDGIGNNADTDDDGDSVADVNDVFPLNPNESADTDHDGIGNNADTDDDGDSVADVNDTFPLNPNESLDTDGDGIGNNADTDDDNDGVADANDAFPLNPNESLDTDGDGIGNNADTDDDNDGVADANDAFSLDPNESLDTDGDGIGNNADTDDDNDSILDDNDAFPLNPNETVDNDGDGIGNNTDPDDDNDGVLDVNDAFPLNASESIDSDHDGVGDNGDPDDDNDGVNDDNDAFPLNASESLDTDGDTIGNNADTDDDGDGVLDDNDAFPLNPNESLDSDGDGIGNNADPDNDNDGVNDSADAFPLDPTESLDTDHDGIGNNADTDDDNDSVADANDAFPLNPAESLDTDHDGIGNNADPDDDDDNVADANDAFLLDATESVDSDGDGIGNNADTDDDDDSVLDANDAFPLDATESVDTDGDGIGNNADTDDDDDSVLDANDAFPLNAAESLDTDGDGIGNNADPDDDNDGIADATDAFPLNPNETVDNDGDGIGNNADPDDDNDGVADATDAFPLNASESVDSDHDGIGNNGDPDDDNDGVNDSVDAFPLDANESVDTDHDGVGNNADSDDDGDGVTDANDAFPLDANESVDTDGDGIGNNADPDDDNDGVNDNVDAFPLNSAESLDTDGDGIGNNADADDDNDGVPDAQDPFPTTRDTIPPVITLAAGPITLWPPDHQYVTIPIANFVLNATDATDSQVSRNSVTITKVTSDEVEDAADDGDGNTLKDMVIATDGKAVALRAERQGGGNGRVYTMHVQVSDRGGNTTTATFKVQVPKSQGKNQAVDDGPVYTVTRPVSSVAAASVDRGSLTDEADAVDKASQANRLFLPVVKR